MADLDARYRSILSEQFELRAKRNPRFSKNAFAKALGLDRTYYSKLSSGKILLSLDLADQVTKKLKLSPKVRAEFLMSAAEEQRCHALYLIDPALTGCDLEKHPTNVLPKSRRKKSE